MLSSRFGEKGARIGVRLRGNFFGKRGAMASAWSFSEFDLAGIQIHL